MQSSAEMFTTVSVTVVVDLVDIFGPMLDFGREGRLSARQKVLESPWMRLCVPAMSRGLDDVFRMIYGAFLFHWSDQHAWEESRRGFSRHT